MSYENPGMIQIDLGNIGDLAKPVTVFIEKISNALGRAYNPVDKILMAKATVAANKIEVLSAIELSDLQKRACARIIGEESRNQDNIEKIIQGAIGGIVDGAKPEELDEDWIANYFDKCKRVSDNEMQSMWSRILASETNSPGSFSKRTIDLVSKIEKHEAHTFTRFCTCVWQFPTNELQPLIYDLKANGLNYVELSDLQNIGLIDLEVLTGFNVTFDNQNPITARYFDKQVEMHPKEYVLELGQTRLSRIGYELFNISGAMPSEEYYKYVIEVLSKRGYVIRELK